MERKEREWKERKGKERKKKLPCVTQGAWP